MTDELGGDPIMEFGSAGPKSYCYQTMSGKSECTNTGTKSSFEINQVLNSDSMMQHIQQELANPLQCRRLMNIDIKDHFVRDSTHKTVSLKDLVKVFSVNWDKRVVEKGTGATYPYGYILWQTRWIVNLRWDQHGGVLLRTFVKLNCGFNCTKKCLLQFQRYVFDGVKNPKTLTLKTKVKLNHEP